ncbi:hypothetical protein [Sphingomonas sp. UYEF23]|uniref:hypothetical protein n=1 Tax=Sphingomonas sp. UYEF23 TaxID=1756408 RepID=UPI0033997BEB
MAVRQGAGPRELDSGARTYRHPDPTTVDDRGRIRNARIEARGRLRATKSDEHGLIKGIFQREIGTNVRSVSPFLLAFVASQGGEIDGLVDRIEPGPRWPRAPALSERPANLFRRAREPYREYVIGTPSGDRKTARMRSFGHGLLFASLGSDWACLDVVDHSLEIEARIGAVKIETLFGVLRIELDFGIPEALAIACVGRPVGDVVAHAALCGRDWPITGVEGSSSPIFGQTLIAETGSMPFRMPWMR